MTFMLYLIKVFLCSAILLGYYWLFLRNRRFHHYNRFYLLGSLLLPVILPFFKIRIGYRPESPVNQVVYQTLDVLTVNYGEEEAQLAGSSFADQYFTTQNLIYLVYAAGVMVLLFMLAKSVLYIRKICRIYTYERINELKFYETNEPGTPFSFFRSIFWNNELPFNSREGQQVFRHELFHVQQKHSTDIILTELITAIFWFNPFFHLLKKELKAIHEFLADQYAISGSDRYAYAELLVLQAVKTRNIPITNSFFQNHIKRRIAMITNLTSGRYSYFSRLMILPVSVLLFCAFAFYTHKPTAPTPAAFMGTNNKPLTVVIDAGHGGIDHGAASLDGTILEKDLNLQISQKIHQLAPAYNVQVVMTRTNDELPVNANTASNGLKARTTLAEQNKADLYVSIHVAATDQDAAAGASGFEVYVSNKNDNRTWQSKQLGAAIIQSISSLYPTNTALLQRTRNIWVLEHTPCPAVLIECGFLTNSKDLAFISNSSNQEALAKKILEGIVHYQNQASAHTGTTGNSHSIQPAAPSSSATTSSSPVIKPRIRTRAAVASSVAMPPAGVEKMEDSIVLKKLTRHFNRNTRYPQKAFDHNIEGSIYYSVFVGETGEVTDFQTYSEKPADAAKITRQVVVGYTSLSAPATNEELPETEKTKILQDEVKRVFERKNDLSASDVKEPGKYYFRASFKLYKE